MINFTGINLAKISEDIANHSAVFEIGPLPKGYGYTLGNTLRRVLLSSLEGAAITSVRINNLDHEFTTIPGVKQNVLDFVLRIKNIRVILDGEDSSVMTLSKKGKGVLKAKDFTTGAGVTIVDGDYEIAELTDSSAVFTVEAIVEKGTGYRHADESLRDEIGRIPIDVLFSPVRMVEFKVLPSRKGSRTDLDKIVISVMTDGTLPPEDALAQSSDILMKFYGYMQVILTGGKIEEPKAEEAANTNMMDWKLVDMELSETTAKMLGENKIKTLGELVTKTKATLQKEVGLKPKALKEVQDLLKQYNLVLAKDAKKSKKA